MLNRWKCLELAYFTTSLNGKLLQSNLNHISPLQSWGPELRYFVELDKRVERGAEMCDLWIESPTYLMKIDAGE